AGRSLALPRPAWAGRASRGAAPSATLPPWAAPASAAARARGLVCIAGYFKLRSHVAHPLFLLRRSGRIRARLRRVQDESRAAPAREASGPRALLRLPLDGHCVPPPGAVARREDLERGAVA